MARQSKVRLAVESKGEPLPLSRMFRKNWDIMRMTCETGLYLVVRKREALLKIAKEEISQSLQGEVEPGLHLGEGVVVQIVASHEERVNSYGLSLEHPNQSNKLRVML